MTCETCHGTGKVVRHAPICPALEQYANWEEPCPECQGSGIAHCCEGLVEQAELGEPVVDEGEADRG